MKKGVSNKGNSDMNNYSQSQIFPHIDICGKRLLKKPYNYIREI
jgi:hypothetical protein